MLVVDHSKFGRNAMVNLGNMSLIDYLYTDQTPPLSVLKVIEQHEVHLAVLISRCASMRTLWIWPWLPNRTLGHRAY